MTGKVKVSNATLFGICRGVGWGRVEWVFWGHLRTYVRSFLYVLSVTKYNITIVQDVLLHNIKEREEGER